LPLIAVLLEQRHAGEALRDAVDEDGHDVEADTHLRDALQRRRGPQRLVEVAAVAA
jgi:hypothetical protein